MEQLVTASLPAGSFGALVRAFRHRACLSQEQLAARAGLSARTVRNLEAGRVQSPRYDTVKLLADALELTGPEQESWFETARGPGSWRAEAAIPGESGPAQLPGRMILAVFTGDAQNASCLAMTCLIDRACATVLAVRCAHRDAAGYPAGHPGCLVLVSSRHQLDFDGLAGRDGVCRITFDKLMPAR